MRSRFFFALLFIGISSLLGQEDFRVAKGLPEEFDRYLTALARQCWETRAALVAQIRTPAEVAARQAYIGLRSPNPSGVSLSAHH